MSVLEILKHNFMKLMSIVKVNLHSKTLVYAINLRQVYDLNRFVQIKPTTCLRLSCMTERMLWAFETCFTTIVARGNFISWKLYTIFPRHEQCVL